MTRPAGLRAVLGEPHFGSLLSTRLIGQAADGMFQVGLATFVFFSPERQTTAGQAAAAFATLLLPYSLVGPFAGVFIDRWRRQRILLGANALRALLVVAVAVQVALGMTGLIFFVTALAVLSVNRFVLSALSASLPHVVSPASLVTGNSLSTTAGAMAAIVGAGLGVGLRAVLGGGDVATAAVLIGGGAGYLLAAGAATRMESDLLGPDGGGVGDQTHRTLRRVAAGVVDGARHVASHRPAAHALAALAAHRFFYGLSTIAALLLYRNYFPDPGDTDSGLGGLALVFAASGAGFLLAAVITPTITRRISKQAWMVTVAAMAAVVEVAFGAPYTEGAFLVAAFFLGVTAQALKICADTIVQESVEDSFRGRVFSFYDILFNVSFVAAAAAGALLLPASGKSYLVLGLIASGYALTALLFGLASRAYADADGGTGTDGLAVPAGRPAAISAAGEQAVTPAGGPSAPRPPPARGAGHPSWPTR